MLDSRNLPFRCTLECQNFRPPAETELTFSAYGHQGTDVCGINLKTKQGGQLLRRSQTNTTSPRASPQTASGRWLSVTATVSTAGAPGMSTSGSSRWMAARPGTAYRLQHISRLQSLEPRGQRRRPLDGVPDGEVARPGGRGLRHLPVRLHQAPSRGVEPPRFSLSPRAGRETASPFLAVNRMGRRR